MFVNSWYGLCLFLCLSRSSTSINISVCHISVLCISAYVSLSLPLSFVSAIFLAPSSSVALSPSSLSLNLPLLYLVSSTPSSLFVSILSVCLSSLSLIAITPGSLSLSSLYLYRLYFCLCLCPPCVMLGRYKHTVTPDRETKIDHSEDSAKVQHGEPGVLLGFLTGLWVRGC